MFEILNGRSSFWQWDINQKLVVQDLPNCAEVHFSNGNSDYALVTLVKTVDGKKVCDVPNVVLQKAGYVNVFAYVIEGEEKHTEYKASILILARSKPEDYIYTETETLCYKNLSEKIGDVSRLETDAKENLVDAVNEIAKKAESGADLSLGITGAEAGQIATVEAVDDQGKPTKWKHENIAGAVGFPAPTVSDNGKYLGCENGAATWLPVEASGGGDISLGLTAASVGQTIKVKAVDENGKPTEWEAAKEKTLKWITVHKSTLTEEATVFSVSADENGKAIADYNPIGIALALYIPADSTQTDNNGQVWVYPQSKKGDNEIRTIGTISGWKATNRDAILMYIGGDIIGFVGCNNGALPIYRVSNYVMDGVYLSVFGNGNHLPVGTKAVVTILCEM